MPTEKVSMRKVASSFIGKCNPSMRFTHRAGEKMFVDYSGLTMQWTDKSTGESHRAQIFVAVLGASNYDNLRLTDYQDADGGSHPYIKVFIVAIDDDKKNLLG